MPAPQTLDDVLTLLRKSNLLEPAKLDAFLTTHPVESASPTAICQKLRTHGLLTPFQAEQLLKGKHKGFFLGKYKILDRIGLGGMGQVFLAEHTNMRRRAALKVMPPDRAENEYSRERFLREARAAGQLDHPNLVRAFDVDVDNDVIFLVMEFVDGVSFQELVVRHGPLNSDRAGQYLWQSAQGLNYLHNRGLVHRDIKPANLLVDRQGIVKILDLGLVRSEVEDDNLTRGEGVKMLGTADYLSPEQAIDCSKVDIRTDIYSLGAMGYFLLTGKAPFEAEKVAQKLLAHQMKPVRPIRELNPKVPPELAAIIHKMLEKKVSDRYQTPAELAEALAEWSHLRIPLPTEAEIPAILGGAVGCSSTISLAEPRSALRTGGSSLSLSGTQSTTLSSSSGSGVRYHLPEPSSGVLPRSSSADTGTGRGLPTAQITPIPKPKPSPKAPPIPAAPAVALPQDPHPPSLPASMTHGDGQERPSFAKKTSRSTERSAERAKIDLQFMLPSEIVPSSFPGDSKRAKSNWRKKALIGAAVAIVLVVGIGGFFLLSGGVFARQADVPAPANGGAPLPPIEGKERAVVTQSPQR